MEVKGKMFMSRERTEVNNHHIFGYHDNREDLEQASTSPRAITVCKVK